MLMMFQDWLATPFRTDQDWFHWFLFVGLIMIIFVAWKMILMHVLS